jgi:2,4-dienoyl-CoA reductase-like NADH-dependent reductase (Old Yellow Enzyme family)
VAHPDYDLQKQTGKPVPGPSAIGASGGHFHDLPGNPGYITPTAVENPRTIIEEYASATRNAKRAGFDGVELHNANGYLPNQFLENHSNHRTDSYGGSVENRMRFSLEILDEIFKVYPSSRVGIKLSPSGGYNDMGPVDEAKDTKHASLEAIREQYVPFVKRLDELKLGYIQMMRPGFGATQYDDGKERGYEDLDIFTEFRPLVKNAKVCHREIC